MTAILHMQAMDWYWTLRRFKRRYPARVRGIVLIRHTLRWSDEQRRLLGLFRIGRVDAIVPCALRSRRWATVWNVRRHFRGCFVIIGLRCDLVAHLSRGSLDVPVFTLRDRSVDSSLPNWVLNLLHSAFATLALFIGFTGAGLDRTVAR